MLEFQLRSRLRKAYPFLLNESSERVQLGCPKSANISEKNPEDAICHVSFSSELYF